MTGRNKHTWTTKEDARFIETLFELHVSEKYSGADNGFKPGYLKAMQQLQNVSLCNSGLKAWPHIKSMTKTWKNHFNIMHNMIYGTNTSEFGWDTNKCCVTADAEVWDEFTKSHKGVACFRDKPFPQFDNLCEIFGKDRVAGNGSTDLGEYMIEETQRNSFVDGGREAAKEMKETFKEVGEKLIETIYNVGRQENKEACDMIDNVIKDIQHMANINAKQRIKAIDIFSKDQFHT
ncbi:hypothetical protein Lser_V15G37355 [Lactuca serriola]